MNDTSPSLAPANALISMLRVAISSERPFQVGQIGSVPCTRTRRERRIRPLCASAAHALVAAARTLNHCCCVYCVRSFTWPASGTATLLTFSQMRVGFGSTKPGGCMPTNVWFSSRCTPPRAQSFANSWYADPTHVLRGARAAAQRPARGARCETLWATTRAAVVRRGGAARAPDGLLIRLGRRHVRISLGVNLVRASRKRRAPQPQRANAAVRVRCGVRRPTTLGSVRRRASSPHAPARRHQPPETRGRWWQRPTRSSARAAQRLDAQPSRRARTCPARAPRGGCSAPHRGALSPRRMRSAAPRHASRKPHAGDWEGWCC